jgi:hypothetical protein
MLTAEKAALDGKLESASKAQSQVAALEKEVSMLEKMLADAKADGQKRLDQLEAKLAEAELAKKELAEQLAEKKRELEEESKHRAAVLGKAATAQKEADRLREEVSTLMKQSVADRPRERVSVETKAVQTDSPDTHGDTPRRTSLHVPTPTSSESPDNHVVAVPVGEALAEMQPFLGLEVAKKPVDGKGLHVRTPITVGCLSLALTIAFACADLGG